MRVATWILGAGLALGAGTAVAETGSDVESPPGESCDDRCWLLTPPREARLIDARIDPIGLVRASFYHTFAGTTTIVGPSGDELTLDFEKADPSTYGLREGFVLEEVELGVEGRFDEPGIGYRIKMELVPREKDGNPSSDYLKDAWVSWDRYKYLDLRMGRMKVPFSQANLRDTADRALTWSPTLDRLVPKRQLGFRMGVGDPWGVARVIGGVFNSTGLAVEQIRELEQLLYVGRLELSLGRLLSALDVSALDLELRLGGGIAWVEKAFDPSTEHRWLGIDAHLHLWRFTVEAEYTVLDFYRGEVVDGVRKADRGEGWHVDVIGTVVPEWLDVVVRVEESDGDDLVRGIGPSLSIDELSRQQKRWVSAGVSVFFLDHARCNVNYVHRQELEGTEIDNDVLSLMCQANL